VKLFCDLNDHVLDEGLLARIHLAESSREDVANYNEQGVQT